METKQRKRVGLALSGGGARGLAHIGVLQVLAEAGIAVDCITGTSMGGVIATGYAAGVSPDEMAEIARTKAVGLRSLVRMIDIGMPRRGSSPRKGLLQGKQVEQWVKDFLGVRRFEDLHMPLTLVAVDLNSGREIHLNEGCLAPAVRATLSIPGLLAPVEQNGMRLVDGGLLNNLPVNVARQMGADIVIGVDVYSDNTASFWQYLAHKRLIAQTIGGVIETLGDALNLVIRVHSLERLRRYPPDFLLHPQIPPHITVISGYDYVDDIIAWGREAAAEILPDLQAALEAEEQ